MENITDAEDGFDSHIDGTPFDVGVSAVSQVCGFGYFRLGKPHPFADCVEFVADLVEVENKHYGSSYCMYIGIIMQKWVDKQELKVYNYRQKAARLCGEGLSGYRKEECKRILSNTKNKHLKSITIFMIIILIIIVLLIIINNKNTSQFESGLNDTINQASIAIPGYESLTLTANSKVQNLRLSNPRQNQCYFQITLYLEDGTELWKSDLIKPGKASKTMKLNQKLATGTYPNAILKYSCFKMNDELTPLNGAETKLTLWVK